MLKKTLRSACLMANICVAFSLSLAGPAEADWQYSNDPLTELRTGGKKDSSLTIRVFYPAPYGVYKVPRLVPSDEPAPPSIWREGLMYYNRTTHTLKYWNNTAWVDLREADDSAAFTKGSIAGVYHVCLNSADKAYTCYITPALPAATNTIESVVLLRLRRISYDGSAEGAWEDFEDGPGDGNRNFDWMNCRIELSGDRKSFRLAFLNQAATAKLTSPYDEYYVAVNILYR